ncbi:sensor histidine kinase [Gordonia sp. CPCC 205333]|uniref:sensor histidine kinase n=1 Tax=Gordonia sp. CPCC 205333 TaxID=3140790 RepID=UPI003AF3F1E4
MRKRYLIANLSLVTLIIAVLGIPFAILTAQYEWSEMKNVGQLDRAYLIAPILRLSKSEMPQMPTIVRDFSSNHGAAVSVFDDSGHVVVKSGPDADRFSEETKWAARRAFDGENVIERGSLLPDPAKPLVIAQEWQLADGHHYAFVIGVPTAELRRTIEQRWTVLGLATVFALACTAAMVWALSVWALGPIRHAETAVRALVRGQDVERISVHQGPVELRTLNAHVNRLADTVHALIERQRFFLADASHQLRNPLVALSLRLENLAPHIDEAGQDSYRKTLVDIDRLRATLSEIMDISMVVSEEQKIIEIDLASVVEDRTSSWIVVAWERHIRIRKPNETGLVVLTRPGALEQALDVLLDNAIKFSPSHSEIVVTIDPGDIFVDIHVIDLGPGMTREDREKAQTRGWRPESTYGGSGLGLSIATMLVTSSGGQLDLLPGKDGVGLDARIRLVVPAQVVR